METDRYSEFLGNTVIEVGSCWNWIGSISQNGYGRFTCKKSREYGAHRFSWKMFNSKEIPKDMVIRHTCDNKRCVSPFHLVLGTSKQNSADMVLRGRSMKGELHASCKLKDYEVSEIRKLYADGNISMGDLAIKYRITKVPVYKIIHRKSWKHIP